MFFFVFSCLFLECSVNDLTLSLSPTLFASFLSSAILMASFEIHGDVLPFFLFGMCFFSAVSNIVFFVFSHNSFASSSFSISSLSRISNLFFISTLYSGVIPLQSYTFILSPVFSVLFSMLLPIVHDRFRSLPLALFSHLLSCFSIFCLSVFSQS